VAILATLSFATFMRWQWKPPILAGFSATPSRTSATLIGIEE
jgi:hypothetical protein